MNDLAQNMAQYDVVYQLEVGDADITGFVDFYLKNPEESVIFELKVVSETSFDHLLQVIIYDYLLNQKQQQDNRLIIFNALKGVRYEILIENKTQLFEFIDQLLIKNTRLMSV